jgi:hypothetical protein
MRNLGVLVVFLISTISVFAQTDGQKDTLTINGRRYLGNAKGQEILDDRLVDGVCHGLTTTPTGMYLSVRTPNGKHVVFLYKNQGLIEVKELTNYMIWGYSSKKNALILSLSDQKSLKISGGDVSISTISSYDLTTKKFKLLADYGVNGYSGIYKVTFENDVLTCLVNVKKKIGSDIEPQTTKIK